MDKLALWIGYVKAVNYDNKLSWFRKEGDNLILIDTVKMYNPKVKPLQFMELMSYAIEKGVSIRIEKENNKTSKYINKIATVEIGGVIITEKAMSFQHAVVQCLMTYVKNIDRYK